jgi:16S rRNA processing protein RimM
MDLVKLGTIVKAQGIKGEVKAFMEEHILEIAKTLETLFIAVKGDNVPYFLTDIRKANDKAYFLLFDEVTDRTTAEKLTGREIFIERKNLKKNVTKRGYTYAVGYKMVDEKNEELGVIEDVFEVPANDVAQIIINNTEVLIPLTEETVIKADKRKKILHVVIPDGIMDVYQVTKKQ